LVDAEQFFSPLYGKIMRFDRFLNILRFDSNNPNYDTSRKIRQISDMPNDTYSKHYAPSEHMVVHEVEVLFKGWVIFKQYIPKKHICFGIKIYKLCAMSDYTYDMDIYLWKARTRVTRHKHK
jgi:hypothetical protein